LTIWRRRLFASRRQVFDPPWNQSSPSANPVGPIEQKNHATYYQSADNVFGDIPGAILNQV
jgi:hypothetical protein